MKVSADLRAQILADVAAEVGVAEYDDQLHLVPALLAKELGCNIEPVRRALLKRERDGELVKERVRVAGYDRPLQAYRAK